MKRMIRGWSWRSSPDCLRVTCRGLFDSGDSIERVGFRVMRHSKEARRVLRGGGWYSFPGLLRVAFRGSCVPGYRGVRVGFRVMRRAK